MKDYCVEVQEAILKHGQVQEDLTDEQLLHVKNCKDCARILDESTRISSLLKSAMAVPLAPDCRTSVISRIQPVKSRHPVFAYAFAALFLLFIAALGAWHIRDGRSKTAYKPTPIAINHKPAPSEVNSIDLPKQKDVVTKKKIDKIVQKPINTSNDKTIRHKKQRQSSKPVEHKQNNIPIIPEPVRDTDITARNSNKEPVNEAIIVNNDPKPELVFQTNDKPIDDNKYLCRYTVQKNQAGETVTWMVFLPSTSINESLYTDDMRNKMAHRIAPRLARPTNINTYKSIKEESKPCEVYIVKSLPSQFYY
jgi:outer membrane biosynthesis protein TonB